MVRLFGYLDRADAEGLEHPFLTLGIRHRATTEVANSDVPVKASMQLTAHKTVTQSMRYVHTEDNSKHP